MVMAGPSVTVDMTENQEISDVVLVMRRGSTATIRAVDERGIPITGAAVSIYNKDGERLGERFSDNDGYVEYKGLPGYFKVEASHEEYVAAVSKVDVRVGAEVELQMELGAADQTLVGRVNDKNGFGINGVAVVARAIDKGHLHVRTGVTDSDGNFSLEGLGKGRYSVLADGGEHGRAHVASVDCAEDVKLVLGSGPKSDNPDRETATETIIEPDPNWSGSIEAAHTFASGLPSPAATSSGLDAPAGDSDNLGVIGDAPSNEQPTTTMSTRFGDADALPVTGPPSGKGGLPIKIGGGAGGAIVTGVVPGSRVEIAGLTKGSRIVSIDGTRVSGPHDARKALLGAIGSVVMLEVIEPGNPDPFTIVVQRVPVR
jgi:hypothetical protein